MQRKIFVFAMAVCAFAATLPAGVLGGQQFNAAAWLDDLRQLRVAMSEHYANLQWVARVRRTDLSQLSKKTGDAIVTAKSDAGARKAFEDFLGAMGDGHLEIDWPEPNRGAPQPASLCGRLGYYNRRLSAGLHFEDLAEYKAVESSTARYFPEYALEPAGGEAIGVVRIGVFSAKWYPELCDAALAELGMSQVSACDDPCADRVQVAAENELTKKLTRAIAALERLPHLRLLVVDLTANGGGTDWLEPAMRELTQVHLRSPVMGFVKHEHWQKQFNVRLHAIRDDLPRSRGSYRRLLERAEHIYAALDAVAKQRCDQNPLWDERPIRCDVVAYGPMYTTGILPYGAPGSLPAHVDSAQYVFLPSEYTYREGVYRGPLVVLVDENTASAAERFAAVLQDNKAARIAGTPTYGAGCGYTNGGIPTHLSYSDADVSMPDCVQFRADGTNAVAGITPDILVPWHQNDNAYLRAKRAYDALVRALRD